MARELILSLNKKSSTFAISKVIEKNCLVTRRECILTKKEMNVQGLI